MSDHTSHHGYIANKDDYLKRLRRIEGQARGLQKMIEEEQYCIDILTQVSAMTRALQSVALGLLDEHLSHCVVRAAAEGGPEAESMIEEVSALSGVTDVKVDLGSGQLIVISNTEIPFENIEAAVDEAGYSVATA